MSAALLEPGEPGRPIPYDADAEMAVLGAAILNTQARDRALTLCTQDDFYVPLHAAMYGSILALVRQGAAVDELTLSRQMTSPVGDAAGMRRRISAITAQCPVSMNVDSYATIVARLGALRRAIGFAEELADRAYVLDLDAVRTMLRDHERHIAPPAEPITPGVDLLALAAMQFEYRWLVPGVLRRGDRVIVTGWEGVSGKTEFLFMLGVMMACGIQPWTQVQEYPPLNVLYLDFENALDQLQPRAHRLIAAAGGRYYADRWHGISLPAGINLRNVRDEAWMDSVIAHHRPDVVFLGPIYRIFEGSPGAPMMSEEAASECTRAIDRLRVRHDVAMLMEAHAPNGEGEDRAGLRPYGASLWRRWPEIGVGLKPRRRREGNRYVTEPERFRFEFWRGTRDQDLRRPWPEGVRRGREWSFIPDDEPENYN